MHAGELDIQAPAIYACTLRVPPRRNAEHCCYLRGQPEDQSPRRL
jgi:hypothetical protein